MYGSLGGVVLKIVNATRTTEKAGGLARTVNGNLRGDTLWKAASWAVEVVALDDAEGAAIYGVANDSLQLFTGTIPDAVTPGGVPVKAEVQSDKYERVWYNGDYAHYRVLALSIGQAEGS